MSSLLEPGRNCWRIEHADKLSFLIDGANYFRALRAALKDARYTVFILGWDIDSRLKLLHDNGNDGYPDTLSDFLNTLAKNKSGLNVYILNWDFAMAFAGGREWLPIYKLNWKTHPRVHFSLDDFHPSGASQHQKIVVIDDSLAFIGGMDLSKGRWDTSDHRPDNPKRDRIDEAIARPYHDVQVMLQGDAAQALAELARDHWRKATGKALPAGSEKKRQDFWPADIAADFTNISIALARTQAAYKGQAKAREIQNFYLDAIQSARNFIYVESQYFTATAVAKAIQASLDQSEGPEIVFVVAKATTGWLSQYTMDVLRVRLIRKLQDHDKHKRFKVYYPDRPDLTDSINVHAKLMVVDDRLVTVGSANLNNRSMGLDNECNVIIDAESDQSMRGTIAAFRNRLLAEHLGCEPEQVRETLNHRASLIGCIDKLTDTQTRYLNLLPLNLPPDVEHYVPDTELVDPLEPIKPELIIQYLLPDQQFKPARSRIVIWVVFIMVVAGMAAMWRWTPLSEWVNLHFIFNTLSSFRNIPAAPLWVVLGFLLAGLVAFPFTLLIIGTVLAFGPMQGFVYSLAGGILSAITIYYIGERLGRNTVRKLAGSKLNNISQMLARHGIVTIVAVRIIPIAPFTVINLVAGASHINFRDYLIGTLLGMTPGLIAIVTIADRAYATFKNPQAENEAWLVATVTVVAIAAYFLVKWLIGRTKNDGSG